MSTSYRQVARRVFAREFNDSTFTFKEDVDDERSPVFVLLPTGQRANRVFVIGTLTETDNVSEEDEYWRGRVVDPTGTFFVYAGQYQPDAKAFLRETEPPAYVAVTGKPRTYETQDGGMNVSLRPEAITMVDETSRAMWIVETANRTLERIQAFDDPSNVDAKMAREKYGDDIEMYKDAVIQALEQFDRE